MMRAAVTARSRLSAIALAGVMGAAFASDAGAQDMLRGSYVTTPNYMQWGGVYGGAQINFNIASANLSRATASLTDFILRDTVIQDNLAGFSTLPNGSTTANGWGGFIGYNWQWDDAVIGMEANYSRSSLKKSASDTLGRSFIDNGAAPPDHTYTYNMTVAGSASVVLTDVATFRAKAGWAVGTLLPYGFVGFAVGRANVNSSANVSGTRTDDYTVPGFCPDGNGGFVACNIPQSDTVTFIPGSKTVNRQGVFTYGGAFGLGFDWALAENLFVRGEWEYLQLQKIEGIDLRINTVRAAVGLKF